MDQKFEDTRLKMYFEDLKKNKKEKWEIIYIILMDIAKQCFKKCVYSFNSSNFIN